MATTSFWHFLQHGTPIDTSAIFSRQKIEPKCFSEPIIMGQQLESGVLILHQVCWGDSFNRLGNTASFCLQFRYETTLLRQVPS